MNALQEAQIVSNQTEVCNIFNNCFVNFAKDIGNDATQYDQDFLNHPSISKKFENAPQKFTDEIFSFKPTTETYVHKVISNLDPKSQPERTIFRLKCLKPVSHLSVAPFQIL